jgi:hypothetical protein
MDADLAALYKEKRGELSDFLRSLGLEGEKSRATAAYNTGGTASSQQRDIAGTIAEAEARGIESVKSSTAREEQAIKKAAALRRAQNIQNWVSTGAGIVGGIAGISSGLAGIAGGFALGSGIGKLLSAGFQELSGDSELGLDPTALNDILQGVSALNEPTLFERMKELDDAQKKLGAGDYSRGAMAQQRMIDLLWRREMGMGSDSTLPE